ncbi:unnamed protein product [Oppiella nova]|uniref:Uncharacterized protein n=1 Tax=Oppiella nova TaxID=334625 RepID=A0A7R9M7A6_9ACAR|nr:unnamed protein product [Oppiella nova]CAG2171565.1 unnamed protein product [Oppiella nova]
MCCLPSLSVSLSTT